MNLQNNLQKGYEKVKFRGEDDVFDSKTMPLYLINNPKLIWYNAATIDLLSTSDMLFMYQNLMKNVQLYVCRNYERRAQLLTSCYAVSREGEVKWVRILAWIFDPCFNVIDIG